MSIFNIFGRGQTGGTRNTPQGDAYRRAQGRHAMDRALGFGRGAQQNIGQHFQDVSEKYGVDTSQMFKYGAQGQDPGQPTAETSAATSDPSQGADTPLSQADIFAQRIAATNRAAAAQQGQISNVQSQLARRNVQMNALRGASGFGGMAQSGAAQAALGASGLFADIEARRQAMFDAIYGQYSGVLTNRMYTPTVSDQFEMQMSDYDTSGIPSI